MRSASGRAPIFAGTDRLKFTPSEQELIRTAERVYGHGPRRQPDNDLPRMVVRFIVWILTAIFLASLAVAVIARINVALSAAPGIQAREDGAEPSTSTAKDGPTATFLQPEEMGHQIFAIFDTTPIVPVPSEPIAEPEEQGNPETPSRNETESGVANSESVSQGRSPERVGMESRIEFASIQELFDALKEEGYLSEFARYMNQQLWTEVQAEKETSLLADPRFDAPLVARIGPGVHYSIIRMNLPCSQIADLTWKLARIKFAGSEFRQGLVCTPEQAPDSPNPGVTLFVNLDGKVVFNNGR